jgi:23S rRNA pseudouridine1911/1915/1917 synthase
MWKFRVKKSDRLDRLLRGEVFPGAEWLSRQAWDWLLENGYVEVSGRKCLKSGVEVALGAEIVVRFPSDILGLRSGVRPAEILWHDSRVAVLAKEPGIPTLPLFPWESSSFVHEAAAALEAKGLISAENFAALSGPPVMEGGLIQRLDNDTSGIVCATLDAPTKQLFRRLFSGSSVEKVYLALVSGNLSRLEGSHDIWLNAQAPKVRAFLEAPKNAVDPNRVRVEVLKQFEGRALVRVSTSQGARHIVRASLSALGAPLLGDQLYGGEMAAPYHQLHALSLKLLEKNAYPGFPDGLEAPLPRSFLDSLAHVGLE